MKTKSPRWRVGELMSYLNEALRDLGAKEDV